MMKSLVKRLKKECIQIDLVNEVDTKDNITKYYENISFVKLLNIYNQYNGLKCYKEEEFEDFKKSYSVDFLELEFILNIQK